MSSLSDKLVGPHRDLKFSAIVGRNERTTDRDRYRQAANEPAFSPLSLFPPVQLLRRARGKMQQLNPM